jgi:hypothetical protein
MRIDFTLTPEQQRLRADARAFARGRYDHLHVRRVRVRFLSTRWFAGR